MNDQQPSVPCGFCHCGCGGRTNIAPGSNPKLGHVKGEPYRYIQNHHKRLSPGPVGDMDQETYQQRYRERAPGSGKIASAKWRLGNPARAKEVKRAFYLRNRERLLAERRQRYYADREKELARVAVANALRNGRLEKGPCEFGAGCRGRIEAHHDDYAKPLEVRWLCGHHHAEFHRGH